VPLFVLVHVDPTASFVQMLTNLVVMCASSVVHGFVWMTWLWQCVRHDLQEIRSLNQFKLSYYLNGLRVFR
jgi:hypothetical protein